MGVFDLSFLWEGLLLHTLPLTKLYFHYTFTFTSKNYTFNFTLPLFSPPLYFLYLLSFHFLSLLYLYYIFNFTLFISLSLLTFSSYSLHFTSYSSYLHFHLKPHFYFFSKPNLLFNTRIFSLKINNSTITHIYSTIFKIIYNLTFTFMCMNKSIYFNM